MREKRTSLDDIAKSVGVSKATVSFVMNGRGDEFNISKEKQRIIRETAKEMAYVPNFFAKSLRQGKTKTIGVVLADITNPFYAELCKTIQEELYAKGYSTLIVNTNDDKELEKILMRELIQRSIDGMIISPCNAIDELIPILHDTHIPVVFSDRPGDENADFIGVDNHLEAGKLITFFSKKPTKLLALSQQKGMTRIIEERIDGIKTMCDKTGIEFKHVNLDENKEEAEKLIQKAVKDGYDSFLPLDNLVALKTYTALKKLKVAIPEKVQLISFDDSSLFTYMDPPISALGMPILQIGQQSVDRLVDRLTEIQEPGKHILLSCEFHARGTH